MTDLERLVCEYYRSKGWMVLRNGWPDFLIYRMHRLHAGAPVAQLAEVAAVEVKSETDRISSLQAHVHTVLRAAGIPVHIANERMQDIETSRAYDEMLDEIWEALTRSEKIHVLKKTGALIDRGDSRL